jgi:hypothetical protein
MAGDTDVAGEIDVQLKGLHGLLSGMKDKTTVEQALPRLRVASTTIERLEGASKRLPGESKRVLGGYVASWLPLLTPMITQLVGNTALAPLVKPLLDGVAGRLQGMAKG